MRKYFISTPLAFALASCFSFAAGYVFHLTFGFERVAAHQAAVEVQAFQRVAAAFGPLVQNNSDFTELSGITTIDELNVLRQKRKQRTLDAAEFFMRKAALLEIPEEKHFAEPFVQEAGKIKATLESGK